MNTINPYILIINGPTGCGKGSLPKKIISYLKLDKNYEPIIIDNLIENNVFYKQNVLKYMTKLKKKLSDKDVLEMFMNPSQKFIKTFNTLYNKSKFKINCDTGVKLTKKKLHKNCYSKNDQNLKKAFKNGKNIVLESRGVSWPQWLFNIYEKDIKKYNYNIVFSWCVTDICELFFRNKNRARLSAKKFMKNYNNPAPRLPNINVKNYTNDIKNIINTFLLTKTYKHDTIRCLIFNNNKKSRLVYDNLKHSFSKGLNEIKKYNVKKGYSC